MFNKKEKMHMTLIYEHLGTKNNNLCSFQHPK